jgi:hypothetical protein
MGTTLTPKFSSRWQEQLQIETPTEMDNTIEIGLPKEEYLQTLKQFIMQSCSRSRKVRPNKERVWVSMGHGNVTPMALECGALSDLSFVVTSAREGLVPQTDSETPLSDEYLERLERHTAELRARLEGYAPHKRFLRTALGFQFFFSGALLLQFLTGTDLVSPLVALTGMAVAGAVMLLCFVRELEIRGTERKKLK